MSRSGRGRIIIGKLDLKLNESMWPGVRTALHSVRERVSQPDWDYPILLEALCRGYTGKGPEDATAEEAVVAAVEKFEHDNDARGGHITTVLTALCDAYNRGEL